MNRMKDQFSHKRIRKARLALLQPGCIFLSLFMSDLYCNTNLLAKSKPKDLLEEEKAPAELRGSTCWGMRNSCPSYSLAVSSTGSPSFSAYTCCEGMPAFWRKASSAPCTGISALHLLALPILATVQLATLSSHWRCPLNAKPSGKGEVSD